MFNLIRSLNYTNRQNTVTWIVLIIMASLPVVAYFMFFSHFLEGSPATASFYFASQMMPDITLFLLIGMIVLVCITVGADMSDRTICYEIMSGHSRGRIFASRTVAAMTWGCIPVLLIAVLPLGVFGLLNGWGLETDQKQVLLRCLLAIFPTLRICAFYMTVTVLLNHAGRAMAVNFLSFDLIAAVTSALEETFKVPFRYVSGFNNVMYLLTSENGREYVINGKPVMVYDVNVTGEMVCKTIIFSLVACAVYLIISYICIRRRGKN